MVTIGKIYGVSLIMNRSEFKAAVKNNGVYIAALFANIAGVNLATVQLWLKTA